MNHIDEHDLERYHLGMVTTETEMAEIEEHILGCPVCAERAGEAADFVDMIRTVIIEGDLDLIGA
jgi:hypothetical protein